MMLIGAATGALELRHDNGGVRLAGRFPYGQETELARGRFERFEARAFGVEAGGEVHLLVGHSFDRPLASRSAGTLELRDGDEALEFDATMAGGTSWARDFLEAHRAGLIRGVSPGFKVAPGGERIERRGDAVVRTVTRAELVEISVVTRAAYAAATVEARNWQAAATVRRLPALARWRA
jgi:uncharacterized protein